MYMPPGCVLSVHTCLGGHPWVDPEPAEKIIYLICPEKALGFLEEELKSIAATPT